MFEKKKNIIISVVKHFVCGPNYNIIMFFISMIGWVPLLNVIAITIFTYVFTSTTTMNCAILRIFLRKEYKSV